jgi:plasmid replication initiation protein
VKEMSNLKQLQSIRDTDLIERRNILNQLHPNKMGLQELRFFAIYLSKINARDVTTRFVRFPVREFQQIMNLERSDISHLKETTDNLLRQIVHIPRESGGYESFQLFNKCIVDRDSLGSWYIEINAHDDALPLMFDFKERYFTYQLRSVLYLKSVNQVRLYELLKENAYDGTATFDLDELKLKLGICIKNGDERYSRWQNFKSRVLDPCRKALESTDIRFAYTPVKENRKVTAVAFEICFVGYADEMPEALKTPETVAYGDPILEYYGKAVENTLTEARLKSLLKHIAERFMAEHLPLETVERDGVTVIPACDTRVFDIIREAYVTYLQNREKSVIKNSYGYLKKLCTAFIKKAC